MTQVYEIKFMVVCRKTKVGLGMYIFVTKTLTLFSHKKETMKNKEENKFILKF